MVVERSGCRLHAWVHGPKTAPLVVLLHGATTDHRMFGTQMGSLLDAGYRVRTMDLLGHGMSKPIGRVPFLVSDLGDDVLALGEEATADRFVVVGQSLGAYVAQDVVLRYPQRILALGIIGATCTTAPISRAELFLLRSSLLRADVDPAVTSHLLSVLSVGPLLAELVVTGLEPDSPSEPAAGAAAFRELVEGLVRALADDSQTAH